MTAPAEGCIHIKAGWVVNKLINGRLEENGLMPLMTG
jgi:hypothetical protein